MTHERLQHRMGRGSACCSPVCQHVKSEKSSGIFAAVIVSVQQSLDRLAVSWYSKSGISLSGTIDSESGHVQERVAIKLSACSQILLTSEMSERCPDMWKVQRLQHIKVSTVMALGV